MFHVEGPATSSYVSPSCLNIELSHSYIAHDSRVAGSGHRRIGISYVTLQSPNTLPYT